MGVSYVIGLLVKLFLLLTPFFILSVFVSTCDGMESRSRRSLALRTGFAVICASVIIYMFGKIIFECLGISLNAFRIGAGLVLMLNGIDMVRSSLPKNRINEDSDSDPAVVPLAIPTTVGPGTIGTLLVMGATVAERAAEMGCNRWFFFSAELGMVIVAGLHPERPRRKYFRSSAYFSPPQYTINVCGGKTSPGEKIFQQLK